jgi:sugar phosphate isomerase/epimerase
VSGAQWSAALDEAKATIEEAVTLQARAIIYPGGGVGEGSTIEDARKRILDGLAQIAPMAHEAGILILVEPLHPVVTADRGAINTLGFALDLCDAVSEGTGVAVDSYNVWWDPQLEASMARAGTRVQGFQVSDWLMTTRHTAFDRGMVGDGVIDFRRIRSLVDGTGYAGPIEIEVLSEKDWWARDLDTVLSTARARINLHLGEAQ